MKHPAPSSRLYDVPSVNVGHWSDDSGMTGCTAVVFDHSCVACVHVAGGAPGAQETDLLDPSCLVAGIDAVLLTGGSVFGFSAGDGVRQYLEEKGRGFDAGGIKVPIAPTAVVFDLDANHPTARPNRESGYAACVNAQSPSPLEGRVGAGTGATVGKYMGRKHGRPGGLASRSVIIENGVAIGALMVANCYGAVTDPDTGKVIAGPVGARAERLDYIGSPSAPVSFGATAIGVVATNASLDKSQAKRVAVMAHDGLARSVFPSHTPYDGDMIFVVSTGSKDIEIARLGAWSAYMVERAMVAAVTAPGAR